MKENLLLLKYLLELGKIRFSSTWQLFQRMFILMLDDIVNKYNTVHRTIKMKPTDVTSDSYAEYNEDSNEKDPKFKVSVVSEYQNTKTSLLMDLLKIGLNKFS